MAKVAPLKPRNSFSEIGSTGLVQYSGYIQEEFLTELQGIRWRRIVREMLNNDPVTASMFFAIEYLCRQVSWEVKPPEETSESEEAAEFIRSCLFDDMNQSWNDTVAEILSFLPWGWSYFETVYKRREGDQRDPGRASKFTDNKIGWRKWAIRAQESLLNWQFDEEGGIKAMVQQASPSFRTVAIPIEKALLFRTSIHKNNPEGRSLLRSAYRPWYFKKNIENYEAIGIERDLAGIPEMRIPSEYLSPSADADKQAIAEECKKIVTSVKADEQAGIVYPSDTYRDSNGITQVPMFQFSLVKSAGQKRVNTREVIAGKNQEILMSTMADFLMVGHQKVGSFALVDSKTELFQHALGSFLDSIAETINRHATPRLLRLNGMSVDMVPKLTHGDISKISLKELSEIIASLQGVLNPREIAYLLGEGGLPKREEEEIQEEEKRREQERNQPQENKPEDSDTRSEE